MVPGAGAYSLGTPSKASLRKAEARKAVGAHLDVKWTDEIVPNDEQTYPSEKDGIQSSFEFMPAVSNGIPNLVFVFSDEMRPKPAKAKHYVAKPTRQAVDSASAWAELFQTEGDYSIFIPGRFFNVVRVDATQTNDTWNKYLYSDRAPLLILTDNTGEIVDISQGKARIKRSRIVSAMAGILRKDEYIQSSSSFPKLNALMVQLEKSEYDIMAAKEQIAEAAERFAKAQSTKAARKKGSLLSSGETAKRLLEKLENDLKLKEKGKSEILTQEYALLKDLGLPDHKMPPEPVEPE